MHAPFEIHWAPLDSLESPAPAPEGFCSLAVWPAPVNPDVCFEAAGFTYFRDNDDEWDARAENLLIRVLSRMTEYGEAALRTKPLQEKVPWYLRPFKKSKGLSLIKQVLLPTQWDFLPHCIVGFGDGKASLRTGDGHLLLWLTLPSIGDEQKLAFVRGVAGPWPVIQTPLNWRALQSAA